MVAPSREARESMTLSSWQPHFGQRIVALQTTANSGCRTMPYQSLWVQGKTARRAGDCAVRVRELKHVRNAFVEDSYLRYKPLFQSQLQQPARGLIHVLE